MGPMSRLLTLAVLVGAGALAVGAVVAAPGLLRAARPTVREGLKRGMEAYGRVRAAASEFIEDVEDLVAEVQAELTPAHAPPHEADVAADPTPSTASVH